VYPLTNLTESPHSSFFPRQPARLTDPSNDNSRYETVDILLYWTQNVSAAFDPPSGTLLTVEVSFFGFLVFRAGQFPSVYQGSTGGSFFFSSPFLGVPYPPPPIASLEIVHFDQGLEPVFEYIFPLSWNRFCLFPPPPPRPRYFPLSIIMVPLYLSPSINP